MQEEICRDFPGGPVVKNSPSIARGASSIPGQRANIPHTLRPKKQKQYRNKFDKDFKKKKKRKYVQPPVHFNVFLIVDFFPNIKMVEKILKNWKLGLLNSHHFKFTYFTYTKKIYYNFTFLAVMEATSSIIFSKFCIICTLLLGEAQSATPHHGQASQ